MVLVDDLIEDLLNVVDLANDQEYKCGNDADEDHCGSEQEGEKIDSDFRDAHCVSFQRRREVPIIPAIPISASADGAGTSAYSMLSMII